MPQWPFWNSKWLHRAKLINQCYYYSSYWVDWPRKHGKSYQNQVSTSFLDQVIGKTNFSPNTVVVIVKFKMAAHAKINYPMLSLLLLLGSLTQTKLEKTPKSSVCVSYIDIWKKNNFGLNIVAAILRFKMAAHTKIPNVIFTCFIGFLDPENMGIATKTKFLWVSNTEILAKTKFSSNGVAAILKCIG